MAEQQILSVIRRYAEVWLAGDVAAIFACYHDDLTLHYPGNHALSGTYVGKPAALSALAQVAMRTNRRPTEVVDVMASQKRGALIVREQWHFGDDEVEVERIFVYTVRDDLLAECWLYDADQGVVARFMNRETV